MPKCRLFRTKRKRRKKLVRKKENSKKLARKRKKLATRKENSKKLVTPIPRVRVIEYTIARNKPINQKKITIHSVFVLRNSATSFSNSFTFSTSTMLISSSVYHSILHCDSTLIRSCSSSVFVLKFVVNEVKSRSTVNPSRSSTLLILLSKRSC